MCPSLFHPRIKPFINYLIHTWAWKPFSVSVCWSVYQGSVRHPIHSNDLSSIRPSIHPSIHPSFPLVISSLVWLARFEWTRSIGLLPLGVQLDWETECFCVCVYVCVCVCVVYSHSFGLVLMLLSWKCVCVCKYQGFTFHTHFSYRCSLVRFECAALPSSCTAGWDY